jgi:hypothetical protein
MASPFLLNAGPGQDKFANLYVKFDGAISEIIESGALVGTDIVLTKYDATQFIIPLATLPVGGDRIISGLDVTITGAGPYSANVAPGVWQIGGTVYTSGAPYVEALVAADPTLDRLDLVVVGSANNDVDVLPGVAAETPVAPTPGPGQLAVAVISVPVSGPPIVIPTLTLPAGTAFAQTLRWNPATTSWVLNNMLKSYVDIVDPTQSATVIASTIVGLSQCAGNWLGGASPSVSIFSRNGPTPSLSSVNLNGTAMEATYYPDNGNSAEKQGVYADATELQLNATTAGAKIVVDAEEGIEITDNGAPAVTTNKLYHTGGTLYWDGDAICVAPCGASYTTLFTPASSAGTYLLPNPTTENERIVKCLPSTGLITIELPAVPTPFFKVIIKDFDGGSATNQITVDGNGNQIDGSIFDVYINQNYGSLTLRYISDGLGSSWYIV